MNDTLKFLMPPGYAVANATVEEIADELSASATASFNRECLIDYAAHELHDWPQARTLIRCRGPGTLRIMDYGWVPGVLRLEDTGIEPEEDER